MSSLLEAIARRPANYRIPANLNTADRIKGYLKKDGHQSWGFVIYRCTYQSDERWNQFIEYLQEETRRNLGFYKGLEMMDSLKLTVFEDKSQFEGADESKIRNHFEEWAANAPQEEQDTGPQLSQRYRYCIQVDEEALNSIPLGTPHIRDGWVKLIWVGLPPLPSDPPGTTDTVGEMPWMRVRARCVMVDMYQLLRDWSDWYREYRSPPEVAHS